MTEVPTPTMKWRPTWPDRPNDFVCLDSDGQAIARIQRHFDGRWQWHMNAWDMQAENGMIDGHPREAAVIAEDAWRRGRRSYG